MIDSQSRNGDGERLRKPGGELAAGALSRQQTSNGQWVPEMRCDRGSVQLSQGQQVEPPPSIFFRRISVLDPLYQ